MGRRLVGLFAALLMANATLASTASACATALVGSRAPTAHTSHTQHEPGSAGHHHGGAPAPQQVPCSAPTGLDCCGAITPCTLAFGVAPKTGTLAMPMERGAEPPILHLVVPASRNTSPDPPPPKS
jgi:hypothetical protein